MGSWDLGLEFQFAMRLPSAAVSIQRLAMLRSLLQGNRISILSPGQERASIFLGLLFVALGYIGTFLFPHLKSTEHQWIQILVAVFFLKATHTVFTVTLFATVPEFRLLLKESIRRRAYWLPLLALLLAVVVFQVFRYGTWQGPSSDIPTAALSALTLTHAARQTFGLLLLYNRTEEFLGVSAVRRQQMIEDEKKDRILSSVLVFILTFEPFCVLGGARLVSSVESVTIPVKSLLVLFLLALYWRRGQWRVSSKPLFSLRLLALPFAFNSLSLLRASGMIHGVESLYICLKMIKNSEAQNPGSGKTPLRALLFSIVVFGGLILFYFFNQGDPEATRVIRQERTLSTHGGYNVLVLLSSAFIFSIGFIHHYVDSIIYQMRDPLIRKHIGPLVLGKNS